MVQIPCDPFCAYLLRSAGNHYAPLGSCLYDYIDTINIVAITLFAAISFYNYPATFIVATLISASEALNVCETAKVIMQSIYNLFHDEKTALLTFTILLTVTILQPHTLACASGFVLGQSFVND